MAQHRTRFRIEPTLERFAQLLADRIGASRVLLFGSRPQGLELPDSDYDLIIVSDQFTGTDPALRAIGLRDLWYETGGDAPLDLICLTPQEFDDAQQRISLIAAVVPDSVDLLSPAVR